MCTFKITNNPNPLIIDDYLKLGGPDLSNTIDVNGMYVTHHLLSITGEFTPQPVEYDGKYFLLMGEIYNYDESWSSDIYFGIEKYIEHGDSFVDHLDGEFLFIVIDGDNIDFFTDPWSTRQCYFTTDDDYWYFTTLRISSESRRFLHNSHYHFNTKSRQIRQVNPELVSWNLDQNVDTLDEVVDAFKEAVVKRWAPNCTLFLSGGVDSSAVALCLYENNLPFNSITLLTNPELEDQEPLFAMLNYCKNHFMVNTITRNYSNMDNAQAEIRNQTKEQFASRVVLTGNGADEFIDNYRSKHENFRFVDPTYRSKHEKTDWDDWPEDLHNFFPTRHFYFGQSRRLLDFHERYNLNFGIEGRNIFYDKKLVQCWLNVSAPLKNKENKGFLKDYLRKYQIPISKTPKAGFSHQNVISSQNGRDNFYKKTKFV
jgi:asparagine synthetase B (glutamine-hydrolysing)